MKLFTGLVTFLLIVGFTVNLFASDSQKVIATGDTYFDIATGHKYIKNSETTYKEYSKKGLLLRESVPQGLPLLTTNKYIREIGESCFFLYEKREDLILKKQILSASNNHPMGWSCESAMKSSKIVVQPKDMGHGYSNTTTTFAYDGEKAIATGDTYFDIATGHKYIKNSEMTYKEYSKKGLLLRESVPQDLPLLTTNKYIREIGESCFFLYQKNSIHQRESILLPPNKEHPQGWSCEKMLSPII